MSKPPYGVVITIGVTDTADPGWPPAAGLEVCPTARVVRSRRAQITSVGRIGHLCSRRFLDLPGRRGDARIWWQSRLGAYVPRVQTAGDRRVGRALDDGAAVGEQRHLVIFAPEL